MEKRRGGMGGKRLTQGGRGDGRGGGKGWGGGGG